MRKAFALLLLPLFFFLAACGNDDTSSSGVYVPSAPSTDEKFVSVVRDEISFPNATDSRLVSMGGDVCDLIDQGATFRDFAGVAINSNIDPHDFGFFIGASIAAYCPEHEDFLNY